MQKGVFFNRRTSTHHGDEWRTNRGGYVTLWVSCLLVYLLINCLALAPVFEQAEREAYKWHQNGTKRRKIKDSTDVVVCIL